MTVVDVLDRIAQIRAGLVTPAPAPSAAGDFSRLLEVAGDASAGAPPQRGGVSVPSAAPGLPAGSVANGVYASSVSPGLPPGSAASGVYGSSVAPGLYGPLGIAPSYGAPAGIGGGAVLAAAQREVGVAEQPPGSNDAPRIAQYRQATAGSGVGPWCGYFVSWAAREAGMPLGEVGQGFGSVDALYAWAQRAGRAVPNGPGVVPRPGDLVVWDEHVGIVESVAPDGAVHTIEGNSSDQVARRTHAAGSALGYVRMG